jgi:tetratricopeptide (TPR) repeat protein
MKSLHKLTSVALLLIAASGCDRSGDETPDTPPAPTAATGEARFVGAATCAGCHEVETASWSGSHHDLAMQPADGSTILGDFSDTAFEYAGARSTFSRRDGRYFVTTDGPDGALTEYPIAYTFGVEPLQQYLIEFPDGRLQALGIAWDSRPAAEGGQRWFHLYPGQDVDHEDELHWTRLSQNWNYMCADCHSTGYQKQYDPGEDRFASTWTDIDVACEACHGPGSIHVDLAKAERLDQDNGLMVSFAQPGRRWRRGPDEATAHLEDGGADNSQVEACGRCHARRASIRGEYAHGQPLTDSYVPALLTEPLYFPDGQIRDEVYVYGSFLQSRMYAAGVVCSDCHQPHSLALRAEGNAMCATCHAPEVFDVASHHHHQPDSDTPACVDCHMPSRDYMVIDGRRDHSFRVPRAELADELGVTDACDACHADRPDGWSAAAVRQWLGRDAAGYQDFAIAFRAAETGQADAAQGLKQLLASADQPAIVRATALRHLADFPDRSTIELAVDGLRDPDPLVRLGALDALAPVPAPAKQQFLVPVLIDPVRSVRTEAARQLAGLPPGDLAPQDKAQLQTVLVEYVAIQKDNADRPEARLNLGILYTDAGQPETAVRQFQAALRLQPAFEPAYINLADLYRASGDEVRAESVLRNGLETVPDSAALHHVMGLLTVRTQGAQAALPWLEQAVALAPDNTRYAYVLAVALNDQGRQDAAISLLQTAHSLRPADVDVLFALATYYLQAGNNAAALEFAGKLQTLQPDNAQVRALLEQIRAQ